MHKYIMWDFDYTLAYRHGMWTQTALDLLEEREIPGMSRALVAPIMKKGFPWKNAELSHKELMGELDWWDYIKMYFTKSFMELGIPADEAIKIASEMKGKYLDKSYWEIFDDAEYALKLLSDRGYKHLILSNHIPELTTIVANLDLDKYFEDIYTSGLIGYEKPHKMIFNHALKLLPKNVKVIMVGDNYKADVMGARNSNIQAVLVRKPNDFNYLNYSKNLDKSCIEMIERLFD